MRGEYPTRYATKMDRAELPPRARRIRPPMERAEDKIGTTSACAENTDGFGGERGGAKNYLRVRGEYCGETIAPQVTQELPPRARRIPVKTCHPKPRRGTTSACAENTDVCHGGFGLVWNYLRVRGEYQDRNRSFLRWGELPPRARRILCGAEQGKPHTGTTSACAENTRWSDRVELFNGNYLRVRGEYGGHVSVDQFGVELPPRARRIPFFHFNCATAIGTTSACAENTDPAPYAAY